MSNAKKCDKCGKYYDIYGYDETTIIRTSSGYEFDYDLCDDCVCLITKIIADDLEKFYEGQKKKMKHVFDLKLMRTGSLEIVDVGLIARLLVQQH